MQKFETIVFKLYHAFSIVLHSLAIGSIRRLTAQTLELRCLKASNAHPAFHGMFVIPRFDAVLFFSCIHPQDAGSLPLSEWPYWTLGCCRTFLIFSEMRCITQRFGTNLPRPCLATSQTSSVFLAQILLCREMFFITCFDIAWSVRQVVSFCLQHNVSAFDFYFHVKQN